MEKSSNLKFKNEMQANCSVTLSFSLDNPKQTGQAFREEVELIIKNPNIKRVSLLKADTLQRLNQELKLLSDNTFRENYSNFELAKKAAREEGLKLANKLSQEWDNDEVNQQAVRELSLYKQLETTRTWEYYRNLKDNFDCFEEGYDTVFKKVKEYYDDNKNFRQEVDKLARTFYTKLELRARNGELNYFYSVLKEFVFEEATVLILASRDECLASEYELYRGERNTALKYAFDKFGSHRRMKANPIIEPKDPVKKQSLTNDNLQHGLFGNEKISLNNNNGKLSLKIKYSEGSISDVTLEVVDPNDKRFILEKMMHFIPIPQSKTKHNKQTQSEPQSPRNSLEILPQLPKHNSL